MRVDAIKDSKGADEDLVRCFFGTVSRTYDHDQAYCCVLSYARDTAELRGKSNKQKSA